MSLQSLPTDEVARLKLARVPGPPPELPRRAPERAQMDALVAARFASRRAWLSAFGSSALSTPGRPEPAPNRDPVLTLVNRITQGFTLAEYERAKALGYEAYLEEQLDPLSIDDAAMDERLTHWPTLAMSPKQLYDAYSANTADPYLQLKGAALARSTNSKRQLFERMVEFWSDHFNIDHNKGLEWALLPEHDRTVIRAHALGSFPEMLRACAFGAGMLYYLDNWLNVRGAPQANYARELMELHTLGVFGGYNESDVVEVAKCFTGWTLNGDPSSPDYLRGTFDVSLHEAGQKFVLGQQIPGHPSVRAVGRPTPDHDAQQVLDILVAHPSTAAFLARKLIRWFLTPTPPQSLVDQVAQTYLDTHGDIKAMLRVILARPNLGWASPLVGKKMRRPFHYMTSIFRTFDARVNNAALEALGDLQGMGHSCFDCAPPTGYADTVEVWGSSLLPRWIFATHIMQPFFGVYAGVSFVQLPQLQNRIGFHGPSDRPGLAGRINRNLFGGSLPPHEEELVQTFIDGYPSVFDTHALFDSFSLAVSLPGFQWY